MGLAHELTVFPEGLRRRSIQRRFYVLGVYPRCCLNLWWTEADRITSFALLLYRHAFGHAQLTDWLAHVPKEVLAKNFKTSISAFDHIPGEELYIFPAGACRNYKLIFP